MAPTADASFGDLADTARQWFDGLFEVDVPTTFALYRDQTGAQIVNPGAGAPVTRSALTWSRAGADVLISRVTAGGTFVHTWHPVATHGRNHFVIESEEVWIGGVDNGPAFAPRVNWYVDEGKAVKPAAATAP